MGVDLLVFPETYPGPTTHEVRYDVVHLIATLADPAADVVSALRAWRLRDGSALEVAVRISE